MMSVGNGVEVNRFVKVAISMKISSFVKTFVLCHTLFYLGNLILICETAYGCFGEGSVLDVTSFYFFIFILSRESDGGAMHRTNQTRLRVVSEFSGSFVSGFFNLLLVRFHQAGQLS